MTLKKMLVFIVLFVVGKVAYENLYRGATAIGTDRGMQKVAEDINKHLPMQMDNNSVAERVEYSNHVMRYFVTLTHGQELSKSVRSDFQRMLKGRYCDQQVLVKARIGIDYEIKKVGLKSLSDKLSNEIWVFSVRPEECN